MRDRSRTPAADDAQESFRSGQDDAVDAGGIVSFGDAAGPDQARGAELVSPQRRTSNATIARQDFLLHEYQTLRKEIETSKSNMFKLVVGGAAIIPAAQSLAINYSIGVLTLALPLIVVVLILLFLTENHSVMRAGTYILEKIEPRVEGKAGWETWLNSEKGGHSRRTVDKLLIFAFSILAAAYFMLSVVLATRHALQEFGQQGQYLFAGAYVGIGMILAFVLYSQAQTNTKSAR